MHILRPGCLDSEPLPFKLTSPIILRQDEEDEDEEEEDRKEADDEDEEDDSDDGYSE